VGEQWEYIVTCCWQRNVWSTRSSRARGERVWFAGRGADERVLVSCKQAIVLVLASHTERVIAFAFALRVAVFTWQ